MLHMLQKEICADTFSLESVLCKLWGGKLQWTCVKIEFYFEITSYCAMKYIYIFCVCSCVYACLSFTRLLNFGGVESAFSQKPFSCGSSADNPEW